MLAYGHVKRSLDIGLCLAAAPFALTLCAIVIVLIRFDSPGGGLFVQDRVGRHGNVFKMFKLRTMFDATGDMPSHDVGAAQITRVGRILRRSKLDELPQILNVLSGSMTLVGPRPCLPTQTELLEERRARGVLNYKPGITGPAQIRGVDMSEPARLARVEADYFHGASVWTDILLLAGTAFGRGIGDAALRRADD